MRVTHVGDHEEHRCLNADHTQYRHHEIEIPLLLPELIDVENPESPDQQGAVGDEGVVDPRLGSTRMTESRIRLWL